METIIESDPKRNSVFNRPGVSDEFLMQAGCHHVGADQCVQSYGCRAEGVAIRFLSLDGQPIVDNEKPFARVRMYDPNGDQKYHQRKGSQSHIFVPPNFNELPRKSTLVTVEGEFKSMALAEDGFAAIGLPGISGAMRNVDGEPRLHDELIEVLEFHNPARVLFLGDSDSVLNSDFAREASKLRKTIFDSKRFSFIQEMRVAVCPLGGPKGVDDVRAVMGTEFNAWFTALSEGAYIVPSKATPAFIFCVLLRRELDHVRAAITSADELDAHKNRVKLLQSAGRLQHESAAMILIRPLLAELLNVKDSEVTRLIKDAGGCDERSEGTEITPKSTPDDDVWPHPVDGAELLEQIGKTYKRFCVLPSHADDVLSVWVLLTYCYLKFEFAAVIAVWSPEPECGKGRVLDVTEKLSRRAFRTANTSAAVLYHSVSNGESNGGITPLIDEFDSQHVEQQEAIGNILKSGFQSNGKAHRMTERDGEQVVVEFSTYCPKMLATIGLDTLDKATRTRSIGIRMQRKKREDKISKFRRYDGAEIRRKCLRWVKDNLATLEAVGPMELDECATDRQEDVWEPLVAIARVAGGDWEKRTREAARQLSGGANKGATEAIGHQLLSAMRDYFTANGDKAHTKPLVEWLNNSGDFANVNHGRGLNPFILSANLKPYGIESSGVRIDGKQLKGYDRAWFDEAFQTYLSPATPDSAVSKGNIVTTPVNIDEKSLFEKVTDSKCDVSKNTLPANEINGCDDVTFPKPENTPNTEKEAIML